MTTQTLTPDPVTGSTPDSSASTNNEPDFTTRIMNVIRLQFVDRQWLIYTPFLILGVAFLITLAVFFIGLIAGATVQDMDKGLGFSWAIIAPMWYLPTAAIMAINPTIHMAFAFSITRRDFYIGTLAAFVVAAVIQGLAITVLVGVERVTGGYGFSLRFADSNLYQGEPLLNVFTISTLLYLAVMAVAGTVAVMYLRWRVKGVLFSIAILILILLVVAFVLSITNSWPAFGAWLVGQTALAFLWLGAGVLVAMVLGYLVIRRITPIN